MGKGKPRHNPDKRQNKKGGWCGACDNGFPEKVNNKSWYDVESKSWCICEHGEDVNICKGNPHNCIKTMYHNMATRSDNQKIEDYHK